MKYFMKKKDEQEVELTKSEFIALERKCGLAPSSALSAKEKNMTRRELMQHGRNNNFIPGLMKPDHKDWLKDVVTTGFGSSIDNVVTRTEA